MEVTQTMLLKRIYSQIKYWNGTRHPAHSNASYYIPNLVLVNIFRSRLLDFDFEFLNGMPRSLPTYLRAESL